MSGGDADQQYSQIKDSPKDRLWAIIRRGLVAIVCILSLHYSSEGIARLLNLSSEFREVDSGRWTFSTTNLSPGSYFISVGRPRSICELRQGSTLIDTNRSSKKGVRDALLLGGSFEKLDNDASAEITLTCDVPKGFKTYLTSTPVIASRNLGILVQGWRFLTQVLLGPTASGFLLLYIIVSSIVRLRVRSPLRADGRRGQLNKAATFVLFAAMSFIYASSLSYLPRFWIDGQPAASLHTVLRSLYAFSFSALMAAYSGMSIPIFVLHGLQIIAQGSIALLLPQYVLNSYFVSCSVFVICTGYYSWRLSGDHRFRTQSLLMGLAGAFTVLQPLDFWATFYAQKENLSPSLLAILSAGLIYIREHENAVREEAEIASLKIHAICDSIENIRELPGKIAEIALMATGFKRARALIDAHMFGAADQLGQIYVRIFETGYKKDTAKDEIFDISLGRSPWMQRALKEQRPITGRGALDNAGFVVVPIGPHILINLSDDLRASGADISVRLEVIEHLVPTFARLKDRIVEFSMKQCLALERLRLKYGRANFERRIGAVFTDIDRYSDLNTEYGIPFASFISDKYYPAMIKSIGNCSAAENFIGDELNLVAVEDLLPAGMDIETAVGLTIERIIRFSNNDGADLCANYGFPHVTIKLGVVVGPAMIVCDSVKVRTAGRTVDEAKRLVVSAGPDQILLRAWPCDPDKIPGFISGTPFLVSQKKTKTLARELQLIDKSVFSKTNSDQDKYVADG